jgi:hypothetical protein
MIDKLLKICNLPQMTPTITSIVLTQKKIRIKTVFQQIKLVFCLKRSNLGVINRGYIVDCGQMTATIIEGTRIVCTRGSMVGPHLYTRSYSYVYSLNRPSHKHRNLPFNGIRSDCTSKTIWGSNVEST